MDVVNFNLPHPTAVFIFSDKLINIIIRNYQQNPQWSLKNGQKDYLYHY